MRTKHLPILMTIILAAVGVRSQNLDSIPSYQPAQTVSGTIRSWGDDKMQTLMKYWQDGFHKYHPNVKFEDTLRGSGTAMAGIYSGVAEMALIGREASTEESMGFEWVNKYKPFCVEVITGSLETSGKTFAPVIFVNKANPLNQLTMTQLDAIFGYEHKRGAKENIRTWGQLGLKGEWADKPIHVYGYNEESGTGLFFNRTVLNGSRKWNPDFKEYTDVKQANGSMIEGGQQILDALVKDKYGIAYSNMRQNKQVKPLALAIKEGDSYYEPTRENLISRKYPLTRTVSIFINRAPNAPIDPKVKEFLRYILSREGQQMVVREGDYLPLTADKTVEQLKKLD